MKFDDIIDYFHLKKSVENAWAFLRLRKNPGNSENFEIRFRDGSNFYLRPATSDRHVFHRLFLRDEYKILDTPPDNLGCVIDIGGHIGTFSFLIAPFAHRVLVFEPVSENYHLLKRNLSGKRFGHVRCVNAAVSDRKKEIKIYISSMGSGSHSTHESVGEEFEVVPALSLEDIFTEYNIERCDLLKIDCEGSEYEILFSTGKDVMSRISRIVLEYHKIQSRESHWNCDSLRENLEANGFEVTMKRSKRKPGQGIMLCDRRGFSNP